MTTSDGCEAQPARPSEPVGLTKDEKRALVTKVFDEVSQAYPYTNYQYVAQNAEVERSRATRHAKAIGVCVGVRMLEYALASHPEPVAPEGAEPRCNHWPGQKFCEVCRMGFSSAAQAQAAM